MADTTVDTPAGPVPIQAVGVGDEVLSRDQECPDEPVRPARVTRVVRSVAPMILWLTLAGGQTMGVTPGHEVWTHQAGWTHAAALHPGDTFASRDGQALTILSIRVDPTPTPIYNLEVDGTFTYFANGAWVHNNSCPIARAVTEHAHHVLAKFLGGDPDGITRLLEPALHRSYHGGLLSRLAKDGVHRPRKMKWAEFFQAHPEMQDKALNIMMDYTREFDSANGTSLVHAVWEQVIKQWF